MAQSDTKLAFSTRYFNRATADVARGVFRKTSTDERVLRNQIDYYLGLPELVRDIFPALHSYSLKPGELSLELEYIPFPNVARLFVFDRIAGQEWEELFHRLYIVLHRLWDVVCDEPDTRFRAIYVQKNMSRFQSYLEYLDRFLITQDGLPTRINGKAMPTLGRLLQMCAPVLSKISMRSQSCIIHGDPCFSNILYNPQTTEIKLIDPRGSFSEPGIYGDPLYDVAKIAHSVHGYYDFILERRCDMKLCGADVWLEFPRTASQQVAQAIFARLFRDTSFSAEELRCVEGWLFLSMLPLHEDSALRQFLLFCRGCEILAEIF